MHFTSAFLLAPAVQAFVHQPVVFTKSAMHVNAIQRLVSCMHVESLVAFCVMDAFKLEQFFSTCSRLLAVVAGSIVCYPLR